MAAWLKADLNWKLNKYQPATDAWLAGMLLMWRMRPRVKVFLS